MRILILFGSSSGCTAGIARRVGMILTSAGAEVTVRSAHPRLSTKGFDAVVVGSGDRNGKLNEGVRQWLVAQSPSLGACPLAFFTVGNALAREAWKQDARAEYQARIATAHGIAPFQFALFAGWHETRVQKLLDELPLPTWLRWRMGGRNWGAIDAWALELAALLPGIAKVS